MFSACRFVIAGLLGLAALAPLVGHAQQVYRIVGPDGRVTFSDRPPPADAKGTKAPTVGMQSGGGASAGAGLPFELRTVASKYPVMLYSGPDCGPCTSGRSYLLSRGVPFTERTITSEDDIEALKRVAGAARLPFMTIGGQQLRGYSEVEWGQFLDAAGYPKQSMLPGGYRNPPPSPLVAVQASKPPTSAAEQPQAEAPPPPAEAPASPSGIRF